MENSPLLYLCYDISNIIGQYLDTYQKNSKLKQELKYKIDRSMVKFFNIKCSELRYRDYFSKHNESLYKIPDNQWIRNRQWVWKGKRMGMPTDKFIIRRTSQKGGVCCSCMKSCNIYECNKGRKMELLLFPRKMLDLNHLGYFRTKLLMNELKEDI